MKNVPRWVRIVRKKRVSQISRQCPFYWLSSIIVKFKRKSLVYVHEGQLNCLGVSSPVLGSAHLSLGQFTCLGVSSPVLGSASLPWGQLTCLGASLPVLGSAHLSWCHFTCLGVSSPVLGPAHLSWGQLTCLGVSIPSEVVGSLVIVAHHFIPKQLSTVA